jgi:hypothetical protein
VAGMTDEAAIPAIAVTVPPKQEVGVFADFAGIWHTPNTFVLDFLSLTSPGPQQRVDGSGDVIGAMPARVPHACGSLRSRCSSSSRRCSSRRISG